MNELLKQLDTVMSILTSEQLEENDETITSLRNGITDLSTQNDELIETNTTLLEEQENLQTSLKTQKQKYYEKFKQGSKKDKNYEDEECEEQEHTGNVDDLLTEIINK